MKFLPDENSADEQEFEGLASKTEEAEGMDTSAPSRLKSRLYSALVREQQKSGPLLQIGESKAAGGKLCVFEELMRVTKAGGKVAAANYCSVCHARVLAEQIENAPIYWSGCPYVAFQKR
jgi:hypothetical protein